jgi:hypothetical protein
VYLNVADEAREEDLLNDVTVKRSQRREAKQQFRKPVLVLQHS